MRTVLDCNIVVSGLIRSDRPPAQVLNAFIQGHVEAVLSPAILGEYRRILHVRKVRRYIHLSSNEIESLLAGLALAAFWIEDQASASPIVVEDPSDDIYLLAAVAGQADYVISGDHHLLTLKKYDGIPIISPRDFLQILK